MTNMHKYKGLTYAQVVENRAKYGSNDLTPPDRESWVKMLLGKFNDPIIKLLLFATLLSLITGYFHGSMVESFGIILAVFLATFLSFINEYKAGKEFDILNKVNDTVPVKVYRDGAVCEIPKNEIVVGDIVVLAQGDEIPADGKLLESMDLAVNESSLNGESKDSIKTHLPVESYTGAYSPNYVYRGTTVSEGDGIFETTQVGDNTEIGKTARQASELTGAETPLNKQLNSLSGVIGKVGFAVATLTFIALVVRDAVIGKLTFEATLDNLELLLSFFMIAVTLIVVAVPEGLAMSVTLSLAYSMRKMTAENALVRKMHACETMGAATVICTDKTGTLTQNKMEVQYISLNVDSLFASEIAGNTTAFIEEREGKVNTIGNPTEGALLAFLFKNGYDYQEYRSKCRIVQRLLFNTQRKYMATLCECAHLDEGSEKYYLFIKGAPEIIFAKCKRGNVQRGAEEVKIYQAKGMRALGFAYAVIDKSSAKNDIEQIITSADFEYRGFVAIADPIRDDVPQAMQQCTEAGIKVKIVTGDTSLTAIEIARQAGLWNEYDTDENFITGSEFESLDEEAAKEAALRIKVMSRARPSDKMRLVRLLQESGEVVAVTGDGTNDAPALNYADVGLAMGSGTAVAKEASDIILLDDSFASVVNAVQWGRSIYLNIQKFIQFQLTINVVALLTALTGPFIGIEFPLTVTQMLWVNLIMDTFAALALATEPSYREVMKKRPRRVKSFIVSRPMLFNIIDQGVLFLAVLLVLLFNYKADGDISIYELSKFFTIFVMLQFWNMFNARTLGGNNSAFYKLRENRSFIFIAIVIFVLQIVIIEFGGNFFRTSPLSMHDWVMIVSSTSVVLWAGEIVRFFKRLKERRR
ncbi:MAG: calcium-translocating P-type ATPase, PMCA-type [Bacteroidales bacterium]|nr:calcium-translocating P-type ATPase, PMCA-type [Bacteroidales bacterium]